MGRPAKALPVFYLGRYRVEVGDPPELVEWLQRYEAADGDAKRGMLRAALLGGMAAGQAPEAGGESAEVGATLDEMLAGF